MQHHHDNLNSFNYITPNSRIIPTPSKPEYHMTHDKWKQPVRTSSLQKIGRLERESMIDPACLNNGYGIAHGTYIEPNKSYMMVDSEEYAAEIPPLPIHSMAHSNYPQHRLSDHIPNPEIQMMGASKSVKSNLQYIRDSTTNKLQQVHLELNPPSAPMHEYGSQPFSLQPVPHNKKNHPMEGNYYHDTTHYPVMQTSVSTNNNRLPKPPLTPLVIPPTPVQSTSSPSFTVQPTRLSSIQNTPVSLTPGSIRSDHSLNVSSPNNNSPITPSSDLSLPHTAIPSMSNQQKKTNIKKQSMYEGGEAERFVHQGIKFHELGKLEEGTEMFRQASLLELPIGLFLYGVALRHGWGCKKNEHLAFQYLQKSAEHAVIDLNTLSDTVNTSASKGELIMAIYELGVSFRHGWGCKKNKETAVHYFKIAANLGDADAQNDLGHCYYNGHGVKKDLFLAAKYYRLADKQGQGIMGNSWIWKSKYDTL
ncbi:hypothetical protein BDB01DRAFT_792518 [Pilobolus umbonatus]|nr:hypothetical protein BDB01DRAFT_792518 [Pilobolus umbonatus]